MALEVEVCYAEWLVSVCMPEGSTVIKAILASNILEQHPEINLTNNVGIFGKKVTLGTILTTGDRVEIYQSLKLSPNEIRLKRMKQNK